MKTLDQPLTKDQVKYIDEYKYLSWTDHQLKTKKSKLTVLSYGGGQDSKALILKYINDPVFRAKYAPGHLVVVMSDTGDEHDYTLDEVIWVRSLCKDHSIPFYHLTSNMGFHVPSWPDLITPQMRNEGGAYKPTMVQFKTKSCTHQLKIVPIYKWLDEYINALEGYGFSIAKGRGCLKRAIKRYSDENGKIRIIIGFAHKEEKRAVSAKKLEINQYSKATDLWEKSLFREFPLVDLKMDRAACQAYITSTGNKVPYPSNCKRCPYMSLPELLWLYNNHRHDFDEWVGIEARKLDRGTRNGTPEKDNKGVFLKGTILTRLQEAKEKYGTWSDAQLNDYKMNHGCSAGSY